RKSPSGGGGERSQVPNGALADRHQTWPNSPILAIFQKTCYNGFMADEPTQQPPTQSTEPPEEKPAEETVQPEQPAPVETQTPAEQTTSEMPAPTETLPTNDTPPEIPQPQPEPPTETQPSTPQEPEPVEQPKPEEPKPEEVKQTEEQKIEEIKPPEEKPIEEPPQPPETPEPEIKLVDVEEKIQERLKTEQDERRKLANEARAKKKENNLNKISEFSKDKKTFSNDEIRDLLHVSQSTATNYLSELTRRGSIKRKGKRGGAKYSGLM
ncbi:MAG: hypothetical protein Q7K55_00955, partial [Candidatus Levybacteria bacterium]|nr:hypothetical protein [Candidatus Levybacteria bacterium]